MTPFYDQNGWKTIPFGAAHTYIAHIMEYPHSSRPTGCTVFKLATAAEYSLSRSNHCYTDMQLIPLELMRSSPDSIRKARASILTDLAGTLKPHES